MAISLAAPVAAVLITFGIVWSNSALEVVGAGLWIVVVVGALALDNAVRSIVKREGLIKGWLVELDIQRIGSELFRSRSLRKSLVRLGRNPKATIRLRRAVFITSALVVAAVVVLELIYEPGV